MFRLLVFYLRMQLIRPGGKFAYSIVGFHGAGRLTYQEALAAVFLEGWVFFLLSIFGIRQWLARAMHIPS